LGQTIQTEIQYLIIGKEIGEENNIPHLQCFVQFKKRLRFSQVKNFVGPRAHIEVARGSSGENFVYCSKDGDYQEFGTRTTAGIGLSSRRTNKSSIYATSPLSMRSSKIVLTKLWKHPGPFLRPKGMTECSKCPYLVLKAVRYSFPSAILIKLKADLRSIFE
jgi:hypothetical protein